MKGLPSFFVVIDNLPQIAAAYSDGVAARVLHGVWRRFSAIFREEDWRICEEAQGVGLYGNDIAGLFEADLIEDALATVSLRPVTIDSHRIVVSLSVSLDEMVCAESSVSIDPGQYRLDMCAAALAYEAIDAGDLHFAEQSVIGGGSHTEVLYRECLVRLIGDDGVAILPGVYLDALERLDLVRAFDREVVRTVIHQLRARPEVVLGCNISGLSVVRDIWWGSVFTDLGQFPDIAGRLVLEITETAPLPNVVDALAFVAALQRAGARVALDDFGVGNSSLSFAREAKVDIVKIDKSFVRGRKTGDEGHRHLRQLVSLVRDFSATVVVEGIESAADLMLAANAGAYWFQGYYFQQPVLPKDALDQTVGVETGRFH